MKINRRLIILEFLILVILGAFIFQSERVKIKVTYEKEPQLNEPITFKISVKKGFKSVNADKVKITFSHKYRKDESVDKVLKPYKTGEYELVYYPQYQGEYQGVIQMTYGNTIKVKNIDIDVQ